MWFVRLFITCERLILRVKKAMHMLHTRHADSQDVLESFSEDPELLNAQKPLYKITIHMWYKPKPWTSLSILQIACLQTLLVFIFYAWKRALFEALDEHFILGHSCLQCINLACECIKRNKRKSSRKQRTQFGGCAINHTSRPRMKISTKFAAPRVPNNP